MQSSAGLRPAQGLRADNELRENVRGLGPRTFSREAATPQVRAKAQLSREELAVAEEPAL